MSACSVPSDHPEALPEPDAGPAPAGLPAKLPIVLERVTSATLPAYAPRLAALTTLHTASNHAINFVEPFSSADAIELFTRNAAALELAPGPGGLVMWVARLAPGEAPLPSLDKDGRETPHADIIGTVQLAFHTSPNGRFRCEVRKLIVDTRYSRRGIARALMLELEAEARRCGKTLCLLDTEAGYHAEALYKSLGWTTLGIVPNYNYTPQMDAKRSALYMYKELL